MFKFGLLVLHTEDLLIEVIHSVLPANRLGLVVLLETERWNIEAEVSDK